MKQTSSEFWYIVKLSWKRNLMMLR